MNVKDMRLMNTSSKIKAHCDIETEEGIVIKGFKIAEGPTGLFVGMPSEKDQNGKWWDLVTLTVSGSGTNGFRQIPGFN